MLNDTSTRFFFSQASHFSNVVHLRSFIFFFPLQFCSADQNRLPFEDPLKPQLPLVEPQFQSVQQFQQFQHRQSLENLATLPLDTLAHSEHQSMSEYEQANMMLRDLHFERVQRQQQ